MGSQQWGQPGKDPKASRGTMGVALSISGSSELGRCHLSSRCEDTETSVPQAGHVVSLSPPPGGVLTAGATRCALPWDSESCSPVAFLPDTEEAPWGAGARGRSGDGCSGGSGCCQVSAKVSRTAAGLAGGPIPRGRWAANNPPAAAALQGRAPVPGRGLPCLCPPVPKLQQGKVAGIVDHMQRFTLGQGACPVLGVGPPAEGRRGGGDGDSGLVFPSSCPHPPSVQAGEMKGQPLVPTLDPSESGSISHVADSTSSELPSDLGMCQGLPTAAAARAELPSPSGPTTASAGSQSSGKAGRQLAAGRFLPAGAAVGLIQLELPCFAPQASWCHRQQREGWSQLEVVVSRRGLPAQQLSLGVQQCKAAPRQGQGLGSPLRVLPATQPVSLQLPPPLGTCSLCPSSQRGTQ